MPEFSKAVHNDLSTAGRFTNSASALLILLAFYIVLLVSKIKVNVKNPDTLKCTISKPFKFELK